jgi:hypothetical protein
LLRHKRRPRGVYWSIFTPPRTEFAPNLGVAYAVTPKTVVRGSYSITYNPPIAWGYGYSEGFGLQSFVDLNRSQVSNGFAPVLYWDQGMPPPNSTQLPDKNPTQLNGSSISYTLPDSLAQAYLQHWNFGVQRDLGKETALELDYVGVKGTRLPSGSPAGNCHLPCLFNMTPTRYLPLGDALLDDIGQHPEIPKPFPSFTGTVAQALRPYPQYTSFGLTGYNVGQSNYNALQVQIRRRPTKTGLGFIMAYTYSKMISAISIHRPAPVLKKE